MNNSKDTLAVAALCTRLAKNDSSPKSYSPKEWAALESRLRSSGIGSPAGLLGMDVTALVKAGFPKEEADRIQRLLSMTDDISEILDRLGSGEIWCMTTWDDDYPKSLTEKLGDARPQVLFGAGKKALLAKRGLAVVGSRNVDEHGVLLAKWVGKAAAQSGLTLFSGGAKGVDRLSMMGALEAEGQAVGILADSLTRTMRDAEAQKAIEAGDLVLATPYSPDAPFSVGNAMGRNKLIYALAEFALVVASDADKGGTWSGAVENLKARWTPVFIASEGEIPEGNKLLLKRGGLAFPDRPCGESELLAWLEKESGKAPRVGKQGDLF